MIYLIDLFCGAGGTTTGATRAKMLGKKLVKVIYAINHDANAIASHKANHSKTRHAVEDIRTFDLSPLLKIIDSIRQKDPAAIIMLWASLECTNFSKAKGGMPRNADSRTLAEHLYRYIEAINPDLIWIENVVEFQSWGPLDENGKPISRKNGEDYQKWVNYVCSYGYKWESKELNSANFGAYTSRNRLFIQFNKPQFPIVWPQATHTKNPGKSELFDKPQKKWKAVRDVLDLEDTGTSIIARLKSYAEPTLERVYAGLVKFVAKGDTSFLTKYYSGNDWHRNKPLSEPCDTVRTCNTHALINAEPAFLIQRNGGAPGSRIINPDGPARTLTKTAGNQHTVFLSIYHGNGANVHDVDNPSPTIPAADTHAVVFIDRQFGNGTPQSSEVPSGSLPTVPKSNLVSVEPFITNFQYNNSAKSVSETCPTLVASRRYYYLLNPQWFSETATSIENPCFTLIARMDKAPPYIVATEHGYAAIEIYETDSPAMVKIKKFMAAYGIVDVKMRMLKINELLRIQGFGDNYTLIGTQEQQKKFIGNSVVPEVVKAMIEASVLKFMDIGMYKKLAA